MNRLLRTALAVVLFLTATAALAATRYVTDELRISVRTGQGNQYRIIEVIGSGTPVETLASEGEWAQVRTPQGNTGWVLAQYLDEQPIAAERLERVRAELEQARERLGQLQGELAAARDKATTARQEATRLEQRIAALEARLAEAERGLALHDENQRLQQRASELAQRVVRLREAAQELQQRSQKEWFLIGGGVLLGGILFGILVTRIPWRRRRDRMF